MNWISVEERLPEDEAVVILSTATGVVTMGLALYPPRPRGSVV